jgi:hypothetical protein
MKLWIPVNTPNGLESLLEPPLPSAAGDREIHAVLCGSLNRVTLRTEIEQGLRIYGSEA